MCMQCMAGASLALGTATTTQTVSAFPSLQPMAMYSSIWNADNWATHGGLVKMDWSHANTMSLHPGALAT